MVGYSYYSRIEFNVVVGIKGDSMDRYLVRMNESLESVKVVSRLYLWIPSAALFPLTAIY